MSQEVDGYPFFLTGNSFESLTAKVLGTLEQIKEFEVPDGLTSEEYFLLLSIRLYEQLVNLGCLREMQ